MGRPTELHPDEVAALAPTVSALLDDIAELRRYVGDSFQSALRRHPPRACATRTRASSSGSG